LDPLLLAAEAPTEDTVAVFDPMGSRRRPRGNATVEWGCSQEAARDGGTPVVKPPRNQHRVRAGARGWSSFSQENSYGGKRQRVERKKGGKKRVDLSAHQSRCQRRSTEEGFWSLYRMAGDKRRHTYIVAMWHKESRGGEGRVGTTEGKYFRVKREDAVPAGNQGEAQPWGTLRGTLGRGLE